MTEKNKSIRNFPNSGNVPKLRFSEFTDEWEEKVLNELGNIIGGGTPSSSNSSFWDGNIPWVSSSDLEENNIYNIRVSRFITKEAINSSATKLCKSPTILIVSRVGVGKVAYSETDICTSQDFTNIFNLKCDAIFLSYLLSVKMKKDASNLQGTSIKGITSSEIKLKKLSIPKKNEQKKIVSFVSLIDNRITTQKKIISHLQTSIQSYRQKIFSRKIRFKDISSKDYPDWEIKKLGEIAMRLTNKNKDNNQNVLTISAQYGLISQLEFFNKSVSAKNVTGYYVLNKNDFAYNKSYSNGYPMGAIKKLIKYEKGVVSTLYICFKFHSQINSEFMKQYFDAGFQNNEIEKIAQEGARNHGLLNISITDFFNIEISLPSSKNEQTKIANFLSSIEKKIETEKKILNKYETQKKYLLANIFI